MTFTEFGIIYNATSMATLFLVSSIIARRYPEPFFVDYMKAYLGGVSLLIIELIASHMGRSVPIDVLEVVLIAVTMWFFVQTGMRLRERSLPRPVLLGFLLLVLVYATSTLASGAPFSLVSAAVAVPYALAQVWLGWRFLTSGRLPERPSVGGWLGVPLMLSGLWFLTYPLSIGSPYAWAGYLVSGIFNMLVGTGLVVFVLEKSAERLRESNDTLTRLNTMKMSFIGVMSHELRTPLTSINTASYLMMTGAREPLSERQTELMTIVQDNTHLLHRFVTDILDFSRMESGVLSYYKSETDLTELVRGAIRSISAQYAKENVALKIAGDDASVPMIADADRLHQAFTNLLVNALKFTLAGGQVSVVLTRREDSVSVSFADTGIGIAKQDLALIFEKFYQVDGSSTRKTGGMGMGLAIAQAIIQEGHGGTVTVESEVGKGSVFTVVLPLQQPAETALPKMEQVLEQQQ